MSNDLPPATTGNYYNNTVINNYKTTTRSSLSDNTPWGSPIANKSPLATRLTFQNINGFKSSALVAHCQEVSQHLHQLQSDIAGFAEPNLNWDAATTTAVVKCNLTKHCSHSSLITAQIQSPQTTCYQPGGIATLVAGPITGRIQNTHTDKLGRWSTVVLQGKQNKPVAVITAYAPHALVHGTATIAQQQQTALLLAHDDTNPRSAFYRDIRKHIQELRLQHEIILMIDANCNLAPNTDLFQLANSTQLINSMTSIHGNQATTPATFQTGSQTIDHILLTSDLLPYLTGAGMTEFDISDHRALFIDLELSNYFKLALTPQQRNARLVSSDNHKHVQVFIQACDELQYKLDTVLDATWTPDTLDTADEIITSIMLDAEKQCAIIPNIPWSPILIQAQKTRSYWRLWQTQLLTNRDTSTTRAKIANEWNLTHVYITTLKQVRINIKQTDDRLRLIRQHAIEHRDSFLQEKAAWYAAQADKDKQTVLENMQRAERKKAAYRRIQQVLQPAKNGGLTHVLTKVGENWEPITDPDEVNHLLSDRNHQHYQQANGTPFTVDPLLSDIGTHANTTTAQSIAQNQDTPQYQQHAVNLIFDQLKQHRLQQISSTLTPQELIKGFRRWRESTSTSPSGRHLGLYRILALLYDTHHVAARIMDTITTILNECIKLGHVLPRWKDITCLMLEKLPGTPRLDKLRVIQLFEADINLAYGILWGRKLVWHADDNNRLSPEQWGSRPKRSAIEVALYKQLTYDNIQMDKHDAATFDNDAKSCYDRIVMNLVALRAHQLGLPQTVTAHTINFLMQARYKVRTGLGVSTDSYTYTSEAPIHGPGQGSRAAPAIWLYISTLLLDCYRQHQTGITFTHPINASTDTRQVDFYVDDATLWTNTTDRTADVVAQIENMAQQWEALLTASGGKFELSKCHYYICTWVQDRWGKMKMDTRAHAPVTITDSITGNQHQITETPTNQAHRTLGVHLAPQNTWKMEIAALTKKATHFATSLSQVSLSKYETRLMLHSVYLPSMSYSLPVTNLTQAQLRKIQSPADSIILSRLGWNQHIPLQVRYGPSKLGGVGVPCFYNVQGTSKALLLLQHLRRSTPLSNILRLTLDKFQFLAGVNYSILRYPTQTSFAYTGASWFSHLHDFLYATNAQLDIPSTHVTPLRRENDQSLMQVAIDQHLRLDAIQACRLFLQVTTVADLSNATGTEIMPSVLHHTQHHHRSTAVWPRQDPPTKIAWKEWDKLILHITTNGTILETPLHRWTDLSHYDYHATHCPTTNTVTTSTGTYNLLPPHRRYYTIGAPTSVNPVQYIPADTDPVTYKMYHTSQHHPHSTTTEPWDAPLLRNIQVHSPVTGNVLIATDGGYDPMTNNGSYGWTIHRYDGQQLATGQGRTTGQPIDSFRCEAFALYSALKFIQSCTVVQYHVYTDSRSLIQRLQYDRSSLQPHDDIVSAIRTLQPVLARIHHVKSHQADRQNLDTARVSLPVRLNHTADTLATAAQQLPLLKCNPCHPVLYLDHQPVTARERQSLLLHGPKQQLLQYYQTRWNWSVEETNSIDWHVLQTSLTRYHNQRFISKVLTGWLPLATKLHQQNEHHNANCTQCNETETFLHLFQCSRTPITYTDLMNREIQTIGISPDNSYILGNHIAEWLQQQDIRDLGQQIPLGFLPKAITIPLGQEKAVKLTHSLWNQILAIWTARNDHTHEVQTEFLDASIKALYAKRTTLTQRQ